MIRVPKKEQRNEETALTAVILRSRQPLLKYLYAAAVLPKAHWNLLHPYTYYMGIPHII